MSGSIEADRGRTASLPSRLVRLFSGLVLFGVGLSLMVRADLGLGPWDVLHQGLSRLTGVPLGTMTIVVGVAVLLLWIPLRQRPGFGTLSNVVVVGVVVDVALPLLPRTELLAVRIALLLVGTVLTAVATGLYVGAALGPGPRDGLMTGLAARGISIRVGRSAVELTVLVIGYLTGGSVGVGTVVFAVTIGPLVHFFLPRLAVTARPAADHTEQMRNVNHV